MKKNFCLLIGLWGLILLVNGCSRTESQRDLAFEQVTQVEFADLNAKISALNLKYADQLYKVADTRG